MAGPLEGFTNMVNLSSLKGFNPGNFENIKNLDDFLDFSENPELLKGAISKIQQGYEINEADLAGLGDKELEFVADLKAVGASGPKEITGKFSELMSNYLNSVDQKHKAAEKAVETFASGGNIDIHSVMIASEKASLSMQLTMQLRNKIVQAYQELKHIRV